MLFMAVISCGFAFVVLGSPWNPSPSARQHYPAVIHKRCSGALWVSVALTEWINPVRILGGGWWVSENFDNPVRVVACRMIRGSIMAVGLTHYFKAGSARCWFETHFTFSQVMIRCKNILLPASHSQSTRQLHPEFLSEIMWTRSLT